MSIERMDAFFAARVDEYDEHMLNHVEGCKEGYIELARLLPQNITTLLDLGCGTGLELHEIFKRYPDASVTGIDLTQAMLDKLQAKYSDKKIRLLCASYFDCDLGREAFDTAISFETMHHFSHADKLRLYTSIRKALKQNGCYIECDYMVLEEAEEAYHYAENRRIRNEHGIAEGEFYHYDTPCTVNNQIRLFLRAGFREARQVWRQGNTTIIVAAK